MKKFLLIIAAVLILSSFSLPALVYAAPPQQESTPAACTETWLPSISVLRLRKNGTTIYLRKANINRYIPAADAWVGGVYAGRFRVPVTFSGVGTGIRVVMRSRLMLVTDINGNVTQRVVLRQKAIYCGGWRGAIVSG